MGLPKISWQFRWFSMTCAMAVWIGQSDWSTKLYSWAGLLHSTNAKHARSTSLIALTAQLWFPLQLHNWAGLVHSRMLKHARSTYSSSQTLVSPVAPGWAIAQYYTVKTEVCIWHTTGVSAKTCEKRHTPIASPSPTAVAGYSLMHTPSLSRPIQKH